MSNPLQDRPTGNLRPFYPLEHALSISSSPSITAIAPALSLVQGDVRAAGKGGHNKFDNYSYSKLEDFLAVSRPILAKHGLSLMFSVVDHFNMPDRPTKKEGIEHCAQVTVVARLTHASGEWVQATGVGEGQDRADKSLYKAITGAKKYLLAGLLAIPTTDDPEDGEHGEPAPANFPHRPPNLKITNTGSLGTTTTSGPLTGTITVGGEPIHVGRETHITTGVHTVIKAPKKLSLKERYDLAYEAMCEQYTMAATEGFIAEIKNHHATTEARVSAMEKMLTNKDAK